MRCPHCQYEYSRFKRYDKPGKGEFFTLTAAVKMTREKGANLMETQDVYGCPSCGKLFIEVNDYEY